MEKGRMKRVVALVFLLFGVWSLWPTASFAARPLFTEDTGTAERGSFEPELAFDTLREDSRDNFYIPSALLKYGLLEGMEVGGGIGYIFLDPSEGGRVDGWNDFVAYLKYRFWDEGKYYPSFALKPQVKAPTASQGKELGSGKTDYGLTAIFSKPFSGLTMHYDLSYFLIGANGETDILTTGLAAEVALPEGWTAVGEFRYANNFNSDRRDDPAFINVGLKKEAGPATFDAAVSAGLNNAAQKYGFTLGVTLKFE